MPWKTTLQRHNVLVISTAVVILILLMEFMFRRQLFDSSLDMIVILQTKLPQFSRYIFLAVTTFGDPNIILPVYFIVLACQINKFLLVKLGLFLCFIAYFILLLKLIYENPRPYWIRPYMQGLPGYEDGDGIRPMQKYAEFGSPSGHAFFSVLFFGYIFYLTAVNHHKKMFLSKQGLEVPLQDEEIPLNSVIEEKNINLPAEESVGLSLKPRPPVSQTLYIIANITFFTLLTLMCISRMYLGMHTLNQILLSLSLGTYVLYIFIKYFDKKLEDFLKSIARQELPNKHWTIWLYSVSYIVISLIPIFVFIRKCAAHPVTTSVIWTDWWVVVQAEVEATPRRFGYIRCFLDCCIAGGFFGIILGALASNGSYTETTPELNTIPKFKIFLRVLTLILTVSLPVAFLSVIPIPEQNYILDYFIRNFAVFLAGFASTKVVPIVYAKLGLDIEGDFLRLQNSFIVKALTTSCFIYIHSQVIRGSTLIKRKLIMNVYGKFNHL